MYIDTDEIRSYLIKLALEDAWIDDINFDLGAYCGDKYDDAYYGGLQDGTVVLARKLLDKFFLNPERD